MDSILKFVRRKDLWDKHAESWSSVEEIIEDSEIILSPAVLKFTVLGNITMPSDIITKLILRKINSIICNIYKVKQSNRNYITHDLKNLLLDSTPIFILKTDIRSFYESVKNKKLLGKLLRDKIVSFEIMDYIRMILPEGIVGLPRGLNTSASLSELYMREFDTKIKLMDNVGYFARYVDDIIIIFYTRSNLSIDLAEQELNNKISIIKSELSRLELEINHRKTYAFYVSKKAPFHTFIFSNKNGGCFILKPKTSKDEICFDYLGYRYKLDENHKPSLSIAKNKVNKIKSRIYNSFLLFKYDNNFDILEKRIRYLFSNHLIYEKDSDKLYAGIYYNYSQCDSDGKFLASIECFYKKILKNHKKCLSEAQYKKLKKISVTAGYMKRIIEFFSYNDIQKILSGLKCYE
jgi:hypothetical protein